MLDAFVNGFRGWFKNRRPVLAALRAQAARIEKLEPEIHNLGATQPPLPPDLYRNGVFREFGDPPRRAIEVALGDQVEIVHHLPVLATES